VVRSLLYGALAGAGGFAAGALVGGQLSDECDHSSELCIHPGTFVGAAAGGTLGLAWGVHVGNNRRGDWGKNFLVAAGVWALGITLAYGTARHDDETTVGILVAIPLVQLGVTTAVERAEGRRRSARRE
jgi:hypothetical protein